VLLEQYPLTSCNAQNWDPVSSMICDRLCAALNGDRPTLKDAERAVLLPGGLKTNIALLYYAKWIREVCISNYKAFATAKNIVALCPQDMNLTVEDCFGTNNNLNYQITGLSEDWLSSTTPNWAS
jgi:hypothetical protein